MHGHGDAMGADGPAMDGAVLPVHGVDGQRSASEGMAAEAADRQPSDAAPKSLSLSQARLHVATTMPSQTVQHFPLSSTVPETMQVQSAVAVAPAVTPAVTATAVHVAAPVATQSTARVAPLAPPHCDPAESVRYWHDLHDSARFSFPTLEAALTFGRTVAARWNFGLRIKSTMVNATTVHKYLCCNRQGVSRAARRKSIVNDQSNSSNNNISNPLGSPNSASRQSDPFAASQRCGCRWTTKIVGEYAEPMSKDGQPHSGQAVWFYSAVQGERMTVHNHETNERELARYGLLSEARREVDGGRGSSVAGGLSEAALETAYRPAEEYMTLPLRQSIHYEQQQQRSDAASMYQQHHQSEETLMFQQRHRAPSFTSSQQSSSDYTMRPTVTSYTSLNVNAPNDRPTAQPFVQPHHSMYRALNTMSTLPLYERPFSIYANGQQQLYAQLPPPIRMPPFEQPPENSHDRNGSERTTTTTTTSLAMRRDPRVASALPAGWRMPLPTVDIREVLRR